MSGHKGISWFSIVLIVLPVLLMVGVLTFAAPCSVHDDGSVSSCHYAGNMLAALAGTMGVLAVLRLMWPQQAVGLDIAVALMGLITALTPGVLLSLCMMASMRCQTLTRPFALLFGLAICATALFDAVYQRHSLEAQG